MVEARTRVHLLTLAFLLGIAPGSAAAQGYRFANIPWGSNGVTLKQVMADQGLSFVQVDSDGDYRFKGTVTGFEAVVWGLMSNGGLAKISVTLFTPDDKARQVYRDMKAVLVAKYGTPSGVVETFDSPYRDGDGREDQAVREDKGHFLALWKQPVGVDTSYLGLKVTSKLNLVVAYEGPSWNAELEKRRAKAKNSSPS